MEKTKIESFQLIKQVREAIEFRTNSGAMRLIPCTRFLKQFSRFFDDIYYFFFLHVKCKTFNLPEEYRFKLNAILFYFFLNLWFIEIVIKIRNPLLVVLHLIPGGS